MLQNKEITTKAGQRIIEQMPNNEKSPKEIAEEMGISQAQVSRIEKSALTALKKNL